MRHDFAVRVIYISGLDFDGSHAHYDVSHFSPSLLTQLCHIITSIDFRFGYLVIKKGP